MESTVSPYASVRMAELVITSLANALALMVTQDQRKLYGICIFSWLILMQTNITVISQLSMSSWYRGGELPLRLPLPEPGNL